MGSVRTWRDFGRWCPGYIWQSCRCRGQSPRKMSRLLPAFAYAREAHPWRVWQPKVVLALAALESEREERREPESKVCAVRKGGGTYKLTAHDTDCAGGSAA